MKLAILSFLIAVVLMDWLVSSQAYSITSGSVEISGLTYQG